jgi:hypothetical protein
MTFFTFMQKSGFMQKIVIFGRIFQQFTYKYWLCDFFSLFLRYLGTLFMFYITTIFDSEIAKGEFSKKGQFFRLGKVIKDGVYVLTVFLTSLCHSLFKSVKILSYL